jgi:hypothetical protein
MTNWMTVLGGVLPVFALLMIGCADDFGTACRFPQSPAIELYCGSETDQQGNESVSTCIDPINPDCDSRLCVSFQGSAPFCSQNCTVNGNCPTGSTCENPGSGVDGVCVPNAIDRF